MLIQNPLDSAGLNMNIKVCLIYKIIMMMKVMSISRREPSLLAMYKDSGIARTVGPSFVPRNQPDKYSIYKDCAKLLCYYDYLS